MKLESAITLFTLSFFVLLNSCSSQTKEIANENELSILFLNDTVSYYNGILTKDVKVTTIPYDTNAIKKLIKQNQEKYQDRLRVFIKLSNKTRFVEPAARIAEIANAQEVFAAVFPLTKSDKSYFKVEEFSWEPSAPVELTSSLPTLVTVTELPEVPALMVEMKKDKSVWYRIRMKEEDDPVMRRITQPIKENLKKVIVRYNEMVRKENKKGAYFVKGDVSLQYPDVKMILDALKENDVYRFKMGTNDDSYMNYPLEENKLDLYMPKDEGDEIKTKPTDSVLTLLLLKNKILAYKGDKMLEAKTYDYRTIRHALMKDAKKFGEKFFVIIKPSAESSNTNTVDILDEMTICNIKRYAMVDLMPVEVELVKKFNSITER